MLELLFQQRIFLVDRRVGQSQGVYFQGKILSLLPATDHIGTPSNYKAVWRVALGKGQLKLVGLILKHHFLLSFTGKSIVVLVQNAQYCAFYHLLVIGVESFEEIESNLQFFLRTKFEERWPWSFAEPCK